MPLTIESYPHIAESIVSFCDDRTLLSVRRVSSWFKSLSDPILYRRISYAIGYDVTCTFSGLPLNLCSNPSAMDNVEVLDIHPGPFSTYDRLVVWKDTQGEDLFWDPDEDFVAILIRAPKLRYAVLYHGSNRNIFRHFLQYVRVPALITPIRKLDFVDSPWRPYSYCDLGHWVLAERKCLVFDASLGPHEGWFWMPPRRAYPRMVFLFLPPQRGRTAIDTNESATGGKVDTDQEGEAARLEDERGRRPEEEEDLERRGEEGSQDDSEPSSEPSESSSEVHPEHDTFGGYDGPYPELGFQEDAKNEGVLYRSLAQKIFEYTDDWNLEGVILFDGSLVPGRESPLSTTIAGLEAWDVLHPRQDSHTWQHRFQADFDRWVLKRVKGKEPAEREAHFNRLRFVTFEEWREMVTPEEFEIVTSLDMD